MRWRILPGLLALIALAAHAERPSTQAEVSTPKRALKYFNHLGTEQRDERPGICYAARTDDEKRIARQFASYDLELAKLKKLVTTRFDREAAERIAHATGDITDDDIDAATESIDGDKATVSGKHFGSPLPMARVNGAWKISIAEMLSRSNGTPDDLIQFAEAQVELLQQLQEEVSADKYANISLLERAVKRKFRKFTAED